MNYTFRLVENDDPEERLEEAALWKALHDEYGGDIQPLKTDAPATFGRARRGEGGDFLDYWNDPAFLRHCQRSFVTVPLERAEAEIAKLHERGLGAFVKSTRSKHWIVRVPVGETWRRALGDMAYSFIDGGPHLMVQELCDIANEHRFFIIDRCLVTFSRNSPELTPLDYPAGQSNLEQHELWPLKRLVLEMAREMIPEHAVIDVAFINGRPGIVELNPMRIGQVGLFACNVRELARASRLLLLASADRSPEGGGPEEGRHAKHESATAESGDAQPTPVSDPISNKGER